VRFRDFIRILTDDNFKLIRTTDTHLNGERKLVTCDYNSLGKDIAEHNLTSMKATVGIAQKAIPLASCFRGAPESRRI